MGEWNVSTKPKSLVREHIERCIDNYGNPLDDGTTGKRVDGRLYEQMRADLMLAVGMLSALAPPSQEEG
jgi:hypothetical protein